MFCVEALSAFFLHQESDHSTGSWTIMSLLATIRGRSNKGVLTGDA